MSSRFYAGKHTHTRIYTKLYSTNDYKNGHLMFIVQIQYFEIQFIFLITRMQVSTAEACVETF